MVPLKLVLDTNVVLDWLVFDDASVDVLKRGLAGKRFAVVTDELAIEELRRVLGYPQFKLEPSRQRVLLEIYRAQATLASMPAEFARDRLMLPEGFPRCRDPDDDHFLALAHHAKASALVSKDRDLLKLRKRARKFGVTILDIKQLNEYGDTHFAERAVGAA